MIDFGNIKQKYRKNPLAILKQLVVNGRIEGADYVALNPKRKDSKLGSFRIDTQTGRFHDFATGERGGSIIDLAAFVYGCSIVEAGERLLQLFPSLAGKSVASDITPAKRKKINAEYIWKLSQKQPHAYLINKKISIGNAKVNIYKDRKQLVIPLTDICPTKANCLSIKGMQFINENGGKFFILPFKGLFHVASDYEKSKDIIVICEGYATARSIAESTDFYIIAAMSACNLKAVTIAISKRFPISKIIIAADNDKSGRKSAEEAKQNANGDISIIYPIHECNDFNDLYVAYGAEAVRNCFKEVIHG